MKKEYIIPSVILMQLEDELLFGQNSIRADGQLPGTGIEDGGDSDGTEDPEAKSFNVWDDWAEEVEEEE